MVQNQSSQPTNEQRNTIFEYRLNDLAKDVLDIQADVKEIKAQKHSDELHLQKIQALAERSDVNISELRTLYQDMARDLREQKLAQKDQDIATRERENQDREKLSNEREKWWKGLATGIIGILTALLIAFLTHILKLN